MWRLVFDKRFSLCPRLSQKRTERVTLLDNFPALHCVIHARTLRSFERKGFFEVSHSRDAPEGSSKERAAFCFSTSSRVFIIIIKKRFLAGEVPSRVYFF